MPAVGGSTDLGLDGKLESGGRRGAGRERNRDTDQMIDGTFNLYTVMAGLMMKHGQTPSVAYANALKAAPDEVRTPLQGVLDGMRAFCASTGKDLDKELACMLLESMQGAMKQIQPCAGVLCIYDTHTPRGKAEFEADCARSEQEARGSTNDIVGACANGGRYVAIAKSPALGRGLACAGGLLEFLTQLRELLDADGALPPNTYLDIRVFGAPDFLATMQASMSEVVPQSFSVPVYLPGNNPAAH